MLAHLNHTVHAHDMDVAALIIALLFGVVVAILKTNQK